MRRKTIARPLNPSELPSTLGVHLAPWWRLERKSIEIGDLESFSHNHHRKHSRKLSSQLPPRIQSTEADRPRCSHQSRTLDNEALAILLLEPHDYILLHSSQILSFPISNAIQLHKFTHSPCLFQSPDIFVAFSKASMLLFANILHIKPYERLTIPVYRISECWQYFQILSSGNWCKVPIAFDVMVQCQKSYCKRLIKSVTKHEYVYSTFIVFGTSQTRYSWRSMRIPGW